MTERTQDELEARRTQLRLQRTREALRREVGPSGRGTGNWQPLVSAREVWDLLDGLDAIEARAVKAERELQQLRELVKHGWKLTLAVALWLAAWAAAVINR